MLQTILLSICVILLSVLLYLFMKKKMFVELQLQVANGGFVEGNEITLLPILLVKNQGELPVYLDYYIFNGVKYPCNNFLAVSHPNQNENVYHIDLPTNDIDHVSVTLFSHDIFNRKWSTTRYGNKKGNPLSWQGLSSTKRASLSEGTQYSRR